MRLFIYLSVIISGFLMYSCGTKEKEGKEADDSSAKVNVTEIKKSDTAISKTSEKISAPYPDSIIAALESMPDSAFIEVNPLGNYFAFDMKYASQDNFLGEKVYDCPKCLLRAVVVKALLKASPLFEEKGYKIKFFDCFRPLYIQKRMWDIKPDSRYVANPNKSGSIHNRGAAVDITLIDKDGKELDMGTKFDHFGEEAHHAYTKLPDTVLNNRIFLKEIMEKSGFKAQNSEWWHYSYIGSGQFPLSNEAIRCDQ